MVPGERKRWVGPLLRVSASRRSSSRSCRAASRLTCSSSTSCTAASCPALACKHPQASGKCPAIPVSCPALACKHPQQALGKPQPFPPPVLCWPASTHKHLDNPRPPPALLPPVLLWPASTLKHLQNAQPFLKFPKVAAECWLASSTKACSSPCCSLQARSLFKRLAC